MENTYQLIASLVMVILAVAASWVAYDQGFLDPLIEKVGYVVSIPQSSYPLERERDRDNRRRKKPID